MGGKRISEAERQARLQAKQARAEARKVKAHHSQAKRALKQAIHAWHQYEANMNRICSQIAPEAQTLLFQMLHVLNSSPTSQEPPK